MKTLIFISYGLFNTLQLSADRKNVKYTKVRVDRNKKHVQHQHIIIHYLQMQITKWCLHSTEVLPTRFYTSKPQTKQTNIFCCKTYAHRQPNCTHLIRFARCCEPHSRCVKTQKSSKTTKQNIHHTNPSLLILFQLISIQIK